MAKQVEIGIVLQGGGALGAYECGAVTALLELMEAAAANNRPVALKAVAGVSIGAINAATVVGSTSFTDARRRINALWDDLTLRAPEFWPRQAQRDLSLFGLPGFYAPRTDFLTLARWTSYYDTTPLLATLVKHVNFAALNGSSTALVVSAVDVDSGELIRFRNRSLGDQVGTPIEPKHILASGSLPPQFPWTTLGERRFWDGGLVNNTPFGDAIDLFGRGPEIERVLVVMDLYPLHGVRPTTIADVEDRVHELSFGNRMRQDRQFADKINELIGTIEDLAPLVPAETMTAELRDRVERAHEYKIVDIVDIDMQDRSRDGREGRQDPYDDKDGLRDFSTATVKRRREHGYHAARARLLPVFSGRDLISPDQARRSAASARS